MLLVLIGLVMIVDFGSSRIRASTPVAGPTRDRRGRIAWGPIAPDLTGEICNQDLLVLAHTTSPWNRIGRVSGTEVTICRLDRAAMPASNHNSIATIIAI